MRIVLTGATGFLGGHLLPVLSAAGHDCLALTRFPPGCKALSIIPRVTVCRGDVFDQEWIGGQLQGADVVINMVGILNEKGRKGDGFHRAHVTLAQQLIDASRATGVNRFIQVSALGAGEGSSHYLVSKGEAEARIRQASDLASTIFQPSVIFGNGDAFFNRFAGLIKAAPVLPLACPEALMQPVWAGDVAEGILRCLERPETAGQTFTAVGPDVFTLRELVEFTARTAGLKTRIVNLSDGMARAQAAVMDFVPGKPFSTDNYRSLQTPNTSEDNGLLRLGIKPRSIHSIVPSYLAKSARQSRLDASRQVGR